MSSLNSAPVHLSRRGLMQLAGAAAVGGGLLETVSVGSASAATPAAAGGEAGLPWPEAGGFGSKAVIGPHQPSAKAMLDKRPILGLPREAAFFYGCMRDAEGNMYELVRGISERGGLSVLFLQSNKGLDTLHVTPEPMQAAATSVGYTSELVGDVGVWKSAASAKGKPFEITISADGGKATWKEEGLFELTGALLGPGLQWHIPDRDGSQLYVSQIYEMTGTLMGKRVRGMAGFDQSYLPDGHLMYGGQDPLFRQKSHHRCWYTWATRYKDGSYDAGHFVLGTDRIGFGLLTNERQALTLDTDVSGEITLVPGDIWPQRIVVKAGGVEWEYLPDPKGRMPDLLNGAVQSWTPQNEGRWRRVGDTREPDVWFAWGEVQSKDRLGYTRVNRF